MSLQAINEYYNNHDRAVNYGKTKNEEAIKSYFWMLLNSYAHPKNYEVVREVYTAGTKGKSVRPDGIIKNHFGIDVGYWESKDEKDVIADEIDVKIKKGYPLTNILFEDSQTAVLFQYGEKVLEVSVRDTDKLHSILNQFFSFRNETIVKFEDALEKFKEDIPPILETLRKRIETYGDKNQKYISARDTFLELCKHEINPAITLADIREMMIQHILTADIFNKIFDEPDFHKHNNIASELEKLIETLFTYSERKNLLHDIEHYYDTINSTAAGITDHHEKQKFLKVIYENFYKVYNPKASDRLGVVYTPNEIVKFMIESTDYLLEKHFGKTLADKNVEILDPATGTGTFITDIIEHIPASKLAYKYKNEIHANEVAILPYYIANLNIEFTFKQKMGYYEEFPNICFVDTLDNTSALAYAGQQHSMFALSSENSERIKRQNEKTISVVIGNPPYNAWQPNYNFQNSNKAYTDIDKRIKSTYIKEGKAQNQITVYDMYVRFYRWATDRIKGDGIVCLITNNSFLNGRAFDGFRKCIESEFDYAYFIDLGGNIRELSGKDGIWLNEMHTIFGVAAAVGITLGFLVKKQSKRRTPCDINYIQPCDMRATRIEKMEFLRRNNFSKIKFEQIKPDKKNNWINLTDNDWDSLLPIIDKETKIKNKSFSIFKLYSAGIKTQRDEWNYDYSELGLTNKISFLIDIYSKALKDSNYKEKNRIKWDRELDKYRVRKIEKTFQKDQIVTGFYRPFCKRLFYFDRHLNGMTYQWFDIFNKGKKNSYITIQSPGSTRPFHTLVSDSITDLHFTGDSQCIPLYQFDTKGKKLENITDWGLEQFQKYYKNKKITKEDIFHYVYAVLHNPAYRTKYEINLKRELPRVPFYKNFKQWATWGESLMDLHINYEKAKQYPLTLLEIKEKKKAEQGELISQPKVVEAMFAYKPGIKTKLKANKETGEIELDEVSTLKGIPKEAWEYKLGNRSALEWILDQYKESKPSDPTIAEKFNTYRFADYKREVIELLKRVTTVSVETMKIVEEMKKGEGIEKNS